MSVQLSVNNPEEAVKMNSETWSESSDTRWKSEEIISSIYTECKSLNVSAYLIDVQVMLVAKKRNETNIKLLKYEKSLNSIRLMHSDEDGCRFDKYYHDSHTWQPVLEFKILTWLGAVKHQVWNYRY